VTKAKLAPNIVDYSKVETDSLVRIASASQTDGAAETDLGFWAGYGKANAKTIGTVSVTPLVTTAKALIFAYAEPRQAQGIKHRYFVDVDRDGDATYEAEVTAMGGPEALASTVRGVDLFHMVYPASAPDVFDQQWVVLPVGFDSGSFVASQAASYRFRASAESNTDTGTDITTVKLLHRAYSLIVVLFNTF
jgi:hypothetical protein